MLHRVNRKSVLRIQMQYVWNTFAQEPGYSIATRLLNVNKNHLRTVGYQHLTSAKCILARRLPFVKAKVAATPESSTAFPRSRSRSHQAIALYRGTIGSLVRVSNNSITTQGKKRMCSFSCVKRSERASVSESSFCTSGTKLHSSAKRRSPQTGAHRRPQHRKAGE